MQSIHYKTYSSKISEFYIEYFSISKIQDLRVLLFTTNYYCILGINRNKLSTNTKELVIMNKRLTILTFILLLLILSNTIIAQEKDKSSSEELFNLSGAMGVNTGTYNVTGISPRDKDLRYSLTGSVNLKLFDINFPFSVLASDQQTSYTQPSNQYGVSPNYEWATFHGGWRSLSYSPFTLAGHTFLGGGFDLTPDDFRISAMYGRFNKATQGGDSTQIYSVPSYERNGFATKIGYGSKTNYFDLILLKSKDNQASLDTTFQKNLKPEENMVFGFSSKANIFTSLFFELEASTSLYTNDTRASNLIDSTSPALINSINKIYPYLMSSQLTTALQSSLAWRSSNFGLKLSYKRVDPNYKSMGAYFIENDVENIIIAPSFKLFDKVVSVTGSIGLQRDNLMNTKLHQSQRIISSTGISINKQDYGIDLKYSSYGITQYKGLNPLIDSLKIARVNSNYNGSFRYSFQSDSLQNNIIIIAGFNTLVDLNTRTASTSQSDNYIANISYQGNLMSSGLNFGINLNYLKSISSGNIIEFLGPMAQIGKSFDNLNIGCSFSYQFQTTNAVSSGGTSSLNLQTSYQVNKHNSFNLNINLINSGNATLIAPSFTEYRSNFGYMYNF